MDTADVIIAGGGLAGLGLAHQLTQLAPQLRIVVLEKGSFPRPHAIAKVGESTVEIGSHYLAHALDLQQHLQQGQLKKFGIRMFFGGGEHDFSHKDELGASQTFGIPTYQVDRGVLENHLAQRLEQAGVHIIDNACIEAVDLGAVKTVDFHCGEQPQRLQAKWLVDAAGRAFIIKNKLDLNAKSGHKGNAVWFRVDKKVVIDDWSHDTAWRDRCTPRAERWRSTNHLTGPGYWVWIIPLASGVTSIGIVTDDTAYHASAMRCESSAREWLRVNQPLLADAIAEARFLDFVALSDYSYNCRKLFSAERWAIIGEAGVFADPFYSPGSDFIAIGNTMTAELIRADSNGEDIRTKALVFDKIYQSVYRNTLSLYTEQYGGFGDRIMMGLKLLWDYSYYWGVLSLLYFRGAFGDFDTIRAVSPQLQQAQEINEQMQALFRERAKKRLQLAPCGTFMDQYQIPCLQHFNQVLMREGDIAEDLRENLALLMQVADATTDMLSTAPAQAISDSERAVLGDYRDTLHLFN